MKLKTSFFNTAVLRKDVTRFAPLWGLYTLFMLLVLSLFLADYSDPARFASTAPGIMQVMGSVNFVYGGLCALVLFGDLFQSKMAGAIHAMPLRREGWFLTHLTAGMLFCIIPNLLGTVLASMMLQQYCYLAFLWLAVMVCQFVFFFGAGAFSVQCAGNRLGAVAVYGLFNLLAVLAAFLATTFYEPVLYGIKLDWEKICTYAPVVGFSTFRYAEVSYNNMADKATLEYFIRGDWRYLFVAVAVGIVLLAAAVLLYRKRQIESAGDFIAVKPVAPVFLIIYTLCAGAALYFIADQSESKLEYLFLVIGFAIGVFTGYMLLEKKVNVFQLKKWLLLGGLTAAFFLTVAITALDPLGITRYVPELAQVKNVQISPYQSNYYADFGGAQNDIHTLTEEADIQEILNIHSQQVQTREKGDVLLRLRYHLKNGMVVERQYYINSKSEEARKLGQIYSRFEFVTGMESVEAILQENPIVEFSEYHGNFKNIHFLSGHEKKGDYDYLENENWLTADKSQLADFLEAVKKDCDEGNMAQVWDLHHGNSLGNIGIRFVIGRGYEYRYLDITVFTDSVHTVAYLKQLSAAEAE